MKPIVSVATVAVVVVGSATVVAQYNVSQVNALADVVDEATLIISFCQSVGVPQGLLNFNAPVWAVTINISQLSALSDVPVSVVYDVADIILGVILLFVSVVVEVAVTGAHQSLISFQEVESNKARLPSVALAGQVTFPDISV